MEKFLNRLKFMSPFNIDVESKIIEIKQIYLKIMIITADHDVYDS